MKRGDAQVPSLEVQVVVLAQLGAGLQLPRARLPSWARATSAITRHRSRRKLDIERIL